MLVKGQGQEMRWSEYVSERGLLSALETSGSLDRVYPINLRDEDRHVFDGYFERELPPMVLRRLENVVADADGWLRQGGRKLLESTAFYFHPEHDQVARIEALAGCEPVHRRMRRWIEQKMSERIDGPAMWVTDLFSNTYFHWMCEAVPRLLIASSFDTGFPVLLPSVLKTIPFVQQILVLFPETNVRWVERRRPAAISELLWISTMGSGYQFNPPLMKFLRSRLLRAAAVHTVEPRNRRLYVSRARCRYRKILNEDEILAVLDHFGFETVFLEDFSLKKQMAICENAEILLGCHGAGLTNMLFMRPGAVVVELQRRNSWPTCYFRLAHALGNQYFYLFCKHEPEHEQGDLTPDLWVEPKELHEILQSACECSPLNNGSLSILP